jgi:hypothetical protein
MQYTEIEILSTFFNREKPDGTSQYFKDRIENFDECYPCVRNECNLFHVHNWIQFFISMYNDTSSNKMINYSVTKRGGKFNLN